MAGKAVSRVGRRKSPYKKKAQKKKTVPKKNMRMSRGRVPITISNPFGSTTLNPKIPDGLSPYSTGLRLQNSVEIAQGHGDFVIILYPGIEGGCFVYNDLVRGLDFTNSSLYGNHFSPVGPNTAQQVDNVRIVQWRIVSQALRLSLNNNCEESDGYFEAIRIDTLRDNTVANTNWGVKNGKPLARVLDGIPAQTEYSPVFTDAATQYWAGANRRTNFIEQQSYVTGKLKDIHKYIFQLRPSTRDHEFTKLGDTNADLLVDSNFDTIVIKIHGRVGSPAKAADGTNAAVAAVAGTRLTAHWISNQEVVYDENSNLTRYHSECKFLPNQIDAMKAANVSKGVKAAYQTKRKI